jgi:hypothetical protein
MSVWDSFCEKFFKIVGFDVYTIALTAAVVSGLGIVWKMIQWVI